MDKIGIMVCEKTTKICGGCICFSAFSKKEKSFERYKDKDVEIGAFFHCNGCNSDLVKDLEEKVGIIKSKDIKTVHMALCIKVECKRYNEIKDYLIKNNFNVVEGTH